MTQHTLYLNKKSSAEIISDCREALGWPQGQFVEQGGLTIGRFDGDWHVTRFVRDEAAFSSPSRINFSSDFFFEVDDDLAEGECVLGTWHTHPPGYGTHFSEVDYKFLFNDGMALHAGRPVGRFPRVHLIFDIDQPLASSAFVMSVDACYDFTVSDRSFGNTLSDIPQDIAPPLFLVAGQSGEKWIRFNDLDLIDLEDREVTGLFHAFDAFSDTYRKTVLENFHGKTGMDSFLYAEAEASGACNVWNANRVSGNQGQRRYVDYVPVEIHFGERRPQNLWAHFGHLVGVMELNDLHRVEVEFSTDDTIRKLVKSVAATQGVPSEELVPVCFCHDAFDPEKYADLPLQSDGSVLLPDDWTVDRVLNELSNWEHPEIPPVILRSRALSDDAVYCARTSRLKHCGYDLSRLAEKRVVIGGVGILGCEIAIDLATSGVGQLTLIDSGNVDWVNIYRQALFDQTCVYQNKAEAASMKLQSYCGLSVDWHDLHIPSMANENGSIPDRETFLRDWKSLSEIVKDADLLVGVFDRGSPRIALQVMAALNGIPFVQAGIAAGGGVAEYWRPEDSKKSCYVCSNPIRAREERAVCTVATLELKKFLCSFLLQKSLHILQGRDVGENYIQVTSRLQVEKSNSIKRRSCEVCGAGGVLENFVGDVHAAGDRLYDLFFADESGAK